MSVPSAEKATCVLVPVAAWCSSVRVWGRAHVWLPGARVSVSVAMPCVAAWCSSVRVWGRAHVWLPGAASVSVAVPCVVAWCSSVRV